jgi:predicted ArsR family transcriptional regulator
MSMTLNNSTLDKIISAIKRKGGIATLTEIKRSISEFNQSGGVEKLRQFIADLIAKGVLVLQTDKGGNGQTIESYRLTNRNVSNASNSNGSNTALKITVTLDMALEGLTDFSKSYCDITIIFNFYINVL